MMLSGVIGSPIGHSRSSLIFNSIFAAHGIDAFYLSMDVKPGELDGFCRASAQSFAGYNVTAPHKISVMNYLDSIEPAAAEIGSVNLVRIVGGKSRGYNVDLAGFAAAIMDSGVNLNGKRILIAGSGGIFRAVSHYIFSNFKPESVDVMVRDTASAGKKLSDYVFRDRFSIISGEKAIEKEYEVLINCTPVGTYPRILETPFPDALIGKASIGIEVVYNPPMTEFLKRMSDRGGKVVTGENLFIYQAMESMRILFGLIVAKEEIIKILGTVPGNAGH